MRIAICSFKGGVGKTLITLNLAGYYSLDSVTRVLVCDNDPQGSSLCWNTLAENPTFNIGRSRTRGFDIELIDMSPRAVMNEVLPEADVYLLPTLLDADSLTNFYKTKSLIEKKGLPYIVVANGVKNRAEHRDRLNNEKGLKGALVIHDRAALSSFYALGQTVFSMTGRHVVAAQKEIEAVGLAITAKFEEVERAQRVTPTSFISDEFIRLAGAA